MAQRSLARIAAGLALGIIVLSSRGACADERTEARAHFKKGMAAIAEGHYDVGIEELKRPTTSSRTPTSSTTSLAPTWTRATSKTRSPTTRSTSRATRRTATRSRRWSRTSRSAFASSRRCSSSRSRCRPRRRRPGARRVPGAGEPGAGGARAGRQARSRRGARPPGAPPAAAGAARRRRASGGVAQDRRGLRRDRRHRVADGAEPARRPELHVDHHRAGHPPLRHHEDPRAPPAPRRRRHHGDHRIADRGLDARLQPAPVEQGARPRRRPQRVHRPARRDALGDLPVGVEDIERIEVVRGPGSALYGADAFNGVINIITKPPGEGGSGVNVGYGDHNTTHGTVWANGRDGRLAYRLSAGYDYQPALEPRGPAGPRRRAHVTSATRTCPAAPCASTATVTRQFGKDVIAGVFGGYAEAQTEILGVGPDQRRHHHRRRRRSSPAYVNAKHFEVAELLDAHDRDERRSTPPTIGQSLLPGDLQHERGRRRGPVHRRVRDRPRASSTTCTSAPSTASSRSSGRTWPGRAREPRRRLRARRGEDRPAVRRRRRLPRRLRPVPVDASSSRRAARSSFTRARSRPSAASSPRRSGRRTSSRRTSASPCSSRSPARKLVQRPTNPPLMPARADLHDRARLPELGERLLHLRQRVLLQPRQQPHRGAPQPCPSRSATLANAQRRRGLRRVDGLVLALLGRLREPVPEVQRVRRRARRPHVPRRGSRRLRELHAHEGRRRTRPAAPPSSSSLLANDARTSANKINGGVQLRTKVGIDAEVDFHFVSPQNWAEQVSDVQKQQIVYQSFHLPAYELLNARLGYRFLRNQAEVSGVGLQPARRQAPRTSLRADHRPPADGLFLLQVLRPTACDPCARSPARARRHRRRVRLRPQRDRPSAERSRGRARRASSRHRRLQGPHPCSSNGHIVGAAIIYVFDRRNPPPPNGLATHAGELRGRDGRRALRGRAAKPGAEHVLPVAERHHRHDHDQRALRHIARGRRRVRRPVVLRLHRRLPAELLVPRSARARRHRRRRSSTRPTRSSRATRATRTTSRIFLPVDVGIPEALPDGAADGGIPNFTHSRPRASSPTT